jgi:hypothetical protein
MPGGIKGALTLVALAAGCVSDSRLQYEWDDRRVLCSQPIDDVSANIPFDRVEDQLEIAATQGSVALLHAHAPGPGISLERLRRTLEAAVTRRLEFVTFRELVPKDDAHAAVALAFDDAAIEAWYSVADLLDEYDARVTFFVTRYANWQEGHRSLLQELIARGHTVEAHAVNHLNARDYSAQHGVAAYLADDVLPSMSILEVDGYGITSFAFPFSASTPPCMRRCSHMWIECARDRRAVLIRT